MSSIKQYLVKTKYFQNKYFIFKAYSSLLTVILGGCFQDVALYIDGNFKFPGLYIVAFK